MRLPSASRLFLRALTVCGFAVLALVPSGPIAAQTEIDITRGVLEPRPIAVPVFEGARPDDAALGREVADVIAGNLERSGLFRPLDRAAFIERVTVDRAPNFADWRIINAETVVVGRVGQLPDGRVQADFRLWDVFQGRQLAGQQFVTTRANLRRIGHLISDVVYERLTGDKGYFDSRIVFIDETGPKNKRVKRLAVMDSDGANVRTLTTGEDLVLTPRFSPSSQEIAYMSYEGGRPRVRLLNIDTRQSELVADASNMTFAPRFAPDGQKIVLSLQDGGNANIYEMDLRTQALTRLTTTPAIDTAPSYSPDGRQIVFESDRDGTQQLYVMNADGSNQQRISFGDGRYSTPVWSPRGDLIAFTKKTSSFFVIGVMRPDGTGERIITEGFHNEGPTWSPNGRVIMFFREQPGANGGPQIFSVDLTGYNERQVATPGFASDPAWSPILK